MHNDVSSAIGGMHLLVLWEGQECCTDNVNSHSFLIASKLRVNHADTEMRLAENTGLEMNFYLGLLL